MTDTGDRAWIVASDRMDGVELRVHVTPRASRDAVTGIQEGHLKIRLTSPPVDDAANSHLIRFVARLVGIPKSSVALVSGARSRHKRLGLQGCTKQMVLKALGRETAGRD